MLKEYENKMENLSEEEQIKRDLYLRDLNMGKIQGPLTNIPNIDKEWLKNYTEEQIKSNLVHCTMNEYIEKENLSNLDDIAISYFDKEISYGEFFKLRDECAKSFLKNGIKEGDKVTICMPSTPETLITVYGLLKIGGVANMVHPLSSQNQIKEFINSSDSKMVITIDSTYDKVKNIIDDTDALKVVVVAPNNSMKFPLKQLYKLTNNYVKLPKTGYTKWDNFIKEGKDVSLKGKIVKYKKDRPTVMLQTGGTTGKSKSVVLTDDNFNNMVEQFKANASSFERGDHMLTVMPPFHGFGLCSSIHLPLSLGVTAVLIPKVNINEIDKLMKKNKINHIVAVPTLFKGMMKVVNEKEKAGKLKDFDLSGLKHAVSGGTLAKNGFETDVDNFFKKHGAKIKLTKGYGLSEAVAGVTYATEEMKDDNNVGIPMVHTSMKIVDRETKETLPNGEIGEICVKGSTVMKEYYNNQSATDSTLIDGWLHTGDLGSIKNGQVYFSDRKGNMIISSGVNVYPNEIEQVIEKHNAVAACAVIGIYHAYKEEVPKAYIALKPGYEINDEIQEEIKELCQKNLDRYSQPASFEYREELPQTLLGKISHNQLRNENKTNEHVKVYKSR